MSYILVVWEQPVPISVEDVAPLLRSLRDDNAMISSARIDEFMARLWKKYPRDLDGEDADYVWEDSFPFAPQPRPRLTYLSISFAHVDDVVPFVLAEAREKGLVVYDSEAGTVSLPTGSFLGKPPLPFKPPTPKAFDIKSTESMLVNRMSTVFLPLGFRWVKIQKWDFRFVRKFPGGWQSIAPKIKVEPDLGEVEVDYLLEAFLDAGDVLMGVETGTAKAADRFVASTFLSGFVSKSGSDRMKDFKRAHGGWEMRNAEELERFVDVSTRMIMQELLPRLDKYRSMTDYGRHALDRVDRNEPALLSEPTIVRLAAVAAAAPDRFDEIVCRELSACDARIANVQTLSPPRPRQLAVEQDLRSRIEDFAKTTRATLRSG